MNSKHASLAIALAAVLSAPAFAQSAVTSSSGANVTSSAAVAVTPGAPSGAVAVLPAGAVTPTGKVIPGGTMVQASSTTTMGAPAPGVKETRIVTTHYWANVPTGVERRADFQRWTHLK